MRRAERLGLWLAVLLLASQAPAVAETPGRIEAAVRAYLVRVGLLDASGAPAASDLAAVLAEGNSAAGPIALTGAGTAAAPALSIGDANTGLFNSKTGGESIDVTVDGAAHTSFWVNGSLKIINANGPLALANAGVAGLVIDNGGIVTIGAPTGPAIRQGSGSPEGVVTAPAGSIYLNTDGGASTTFYVKESGTGNTGWAAK